MQYFTVTCLFGLLLAVSANPHYIPISTIEHIPNPNYSFNYAVNDPFTGDNKGQWEMRNGDQVKGSYSLVEPDGSVRVVDYYADDHTGFNADVKRLGPAHHPVPLAPVAIIKPVITPVLPAPIHPVPIISSLPPLPPMPVRMWEPIPKPLAPLRTFGPKPIGPFGKPIVVPDHFGPVPAFDRLNFVPLIVPPEEYHYKPAPGVTISGATYGKHGMIKSWSSGPINLDGRSLIIRHKH